VLKWGEVRMLTAPDPVLALERSLNGTRLRAWFNTGNEACVFQVDDMNGFNVIDGHGLISGELGESRVQLPAFGVLFAERR
jgi:alpha-glucosidase